MATLLVTRRMSPELRARVEASVAGRRKASGRTKAPWLRAGVRAGLVLFAALLLVAGVRMRRQALAELEAEQNALLARLEREARAFSERERLIAERVETWLLHAAEPYRGDSVAAELRGAGLAAALARPAVYVRGSLATFAEPGGLAASAESSFPDAFVLCLHAPPATRKEKALASRARAVLAGATRREVPHVARLADALRVLPLFAPAFTGRVRSADHPRELAVLRDVLERAPLAGARAAARAELLLFAIDEPGDPALPAELDGERPHRVRIGIVDLAAEKSLLALRRTVDPTSLSAAARAEHASGIDSCALALDVRDAVTQGGG